MSLSVLVSNRCVGLLRCNLVPWAIPFLVFAVTTLLPQPASGGAWTLEKGRVWSKLTFMSQSTDQHYDADGKAVEIPLDARFQSRQVYFSVYYGLTDLVDLGLQVPYISNKFVDKDEGNDTATPPPALEPESGIGDLRGFAKINLLQQAGLAGTLNLGFKLPVGEYRPVPEALSITGGQWDFDAVAQLGRSFSPVPAYANLDLGYRLRGEYKDTDGIDPDRSYTPGAEFVFNLEAGYSPRDRLLVALKYEGMSGAEYDAVSNPGSPESLSQSVAYLVPTVLVGLHPNLSLEASARMTVSGSRYFAGSTYSLGLSYTGNLIEKLIHQGTPLPPSGE